MGTDPLRSGAIFKVPDASVLRQSPAPRLLHRPMPVKPPLPTSAVSGIAVAGSADISYAAVPYMSPEAVSNRFETIFRAIMNQLPMVNSPHEQSCAALSELVAPPRASAGPPQSPMIPASSIAMLSQISMRNVSGPSGSATSVALVAGAPLTSLTASPPPEKEIESQIDSSSMRTPQKSSTSSPKVPPSREIFKTPEVLAKSSAGEIALTEWSLRRESKSSNGILLEGRGPNEFKRWHSSALQTRISARKVRTVSGSVYRLVGPINEELMKDLFPVALITSLKDGLPENWQALFDALTTASPSPAPTELSVATTPVQTTTPAQVQTPGTGELITMKHRPRRRTDDKESKQAKDATTKKTPEPKGSDAEREKEKEEKEKEKEKEKEERKQKEENEKMEKERREKEENERVANEKEEITREKKQRDKDAAKMKEKKNKEGKAAPELLEPEEPILEHPADDNPDAVQPDDKTDEQEDESKPAQPTPTATTGKREQAKAKEWEGKRRKEEEKARKYQELLEKEITHEEQKKRDKQINESEKSKSPAVPHKPMRLPRTPQSQALQQRTPPSSATTLLPTGKEKSRSGRNLTPALAFWANVRPCYDADRTLKAIEVSDAAPSAVVPQAPSQKRSTPVKSAGKLGRKRAKSKPAAPVKPKPATKERRKAEKPLKQKTAVATAKKGKSRRSKQDEDELSPAKPQPNISSLLGRRKRRLLDEDSDWAPDEVEKLYKALSSVDLPTTDPLYWGKIGTAVGRSADDCFERYHRAHPTPAKKDSKKDKETSPVRLDHGKKTNIQRRNIRKILSKAQENHADDAFDQTPLKRQSNALLLSPSIATPPNFPVKGTLSVLDAPNGSSPVPDLLRPVDHATADAYVNRMQRMRRPAVVSTPEKKDKESDEDRSPNQEDDQLSEAPMEGAEAEDYYFSS